MEKTIEPIFTNLLNLSNIGNIASILGLFITIITLSTVNDIRKSYILKARLPDQLKNLKELNSNLIKLMGNFNGNKENIKTNIIQIRALISSISKKIDKGPKSKAKLIMKVKVDESLDENRSRYIYNSTLELYTLLQEFLRDQKWEA